MNETTEIIPVHKWTNGGPEVLILRCCDADGKSYKGFQWTLTVGETVEAPDWIPNAQCGNGLHGWPWGIAMGDGKCPNWDGKWIVFGSDPSTVVSLGGKVKVQRGVIWFVGDWNEAMEFVLPGQMNWVHQAASGAASATGCSGAASATGYSGAAVVTGLCGIATGGKYGCIALAWWNDDAERVEMRCAEIGCGDGSDGKLKSDTKYRMGEAGNFEEVSE